MAKLIIKSDYAAMITPFCSTEETRYYLGGFNVKPNPHGDGVNVCATDGHTFGLFYDETGVIDLDETATGDIWKLDKDTLKACKPKRDTQDRWLVILPRDMEIHNLSIVLADNAVEAEKTALEACPIDNILHTALIRPINGSYPDYDRVIPSDTFDNVKLVRQAPPSFNGAYLAKFAAVSKAHENPDEFVTLHITEKTNPTLVQTAHPNFIGVIMPVRSCPWVSMPRWYTGLAAPTQIAAE